MKKYDFIICGAGPAGLAFAATLHQKGINNFLILEKEAEAGGLCRSVTMDDAPFDFGGGHFLDIRDESVLDFVFRYLPKEEWNLYPRDSRIWIDGEEINSPIEANIWQMNTENQIEYLKSIFRAGCNSGSAIPTHFKDWIRWKLGEMIAERYMLPYNTKMFGDDLDQLGTYWLEKLPNVSFDDTLRSCLNKKAYGTQPGHTFFYYPQKYGYGEVWSRIAQSLNNFIVYNCPAMEIEAEHNVINNTFTADIIINTAPWDSVKWIGIPDNIQSDINALKYSSIITEYHPEPLETDAQWVYIPDISLPYHRILVRKNFFPNARGYWAETNKTRFQKGDYVFYENKYAYPLNTIGKEEAMDELLGYMRSKFIYGLGRWGEWKHLNSDVVVRHGIDMAEKILSNK